MEQLTAPKNNEKEGKPCPSLLPMDILTKYLIPAYEEGLKKYGRDTWRCGFKTSVMIDAALRHIVSFYWDVEDYDKDSLNQNGVKKHHLGGAIFSLLAILNTLETRPELDDRKKTF